MTKSCLSVIIIAIMMFGSNMVSGQGMAINATGAAANGSAMLDVSSSSQGMLAPRTTAAQRTAINSPATGLLVYQTDGTAGFYYYNGAAWIWLLGNNNVTLPPSGALVSSTTTAGGDLSGSYPSPSLAVSGVGAGTYGSATAIPVLSIDAKGRTTAAATAAVPLVIFTSFNNTGNAPTYFPLGGTMALTNNTTITQAETQAPVGFTITAMTVVIYNTTGNSTRDEPTITLYVNESPTTMTYQYTTSGGFKNVGQYKSGVITPATPVTIAAGDMLAIDYTDSQSGYTENVAVTFYGHY